MPTNAEFFGASLPKVDPLWTDLRDMIRNHAESNPRNLQRALGPSQVGHPCMRRMAYGMAEVPRSNPAWDCLPSAYGVAMHKWLEKAAHADNEARGRRRWIIETKVEVCRGLSGTADLFDTDTGDVIDWKNLGYTSFDQHVRKPGPAYRNQVQLYGRGFKRLGYDVKRVIVAMLPRTGTLTKMHLDIQPYDDARVDQVLARREATMMLMQDLNVEADPERYQWIPATPEECRFCPQWSINPTNPLQCSGKAS